VKVALKPDGIRVSLPAYGVGYPLNPRELSCPLNPSSVRGSGGRKTLSPNAGAGAAGRS